MTTFDGFLQRCKARGEAPCHALEAAGVSKTYYSRWKKNPDWQPTLTVLSRLASYFGCSYDDILHPDRMPSKTTSLLMTAVSSLDEDQQAFLLRFISFMKDEWK